MGLYGRILKEHMVAQAAVLKARNELHGEGVSDPTTFQLAQHLGWDMEKVKEVREQMRADLVPPTR
jgi:hypothetical protein